MAEETISLPFLIDAYGKVSSTTDQSKIWSDRVRFVIGTNLQERIFRPDFGTLVPKAFMEQQDVAEELIIAEIERAFPIQLSLLTLNAVEVSFDEYTSTTHVNVIYGLPNGEVTNTAVAVAYIDGNNPAVQENL